jgi:pyridoxamine 5'-phosphate oxidase
MNLSSIRKSYEKHTLTESKVAPNPYDQFKTWFSQNLKSDNPEPTAMTLSTATKTGRPSARVVLLKEYDAKQGFCFYTNYESKKGQELKANPYASLLFFWPSLERQIRIEGKVKKVTKANSEAYFQSRPRASQLGAWTSSQSKVIPDRVFIDSVLNQMEEYFKFEKILPLPPFWGGYTLIPTYFEFWQGRRDRLHDRIAYTSKRGNWVIERLSP